MVCAGKQDFLQWRNTWLALPLLIQWHLVRLSMMTMVLTLNGLLLLVPILMQLRNVATFLAVWLKALQLSCGCSCNSGCGIGKLNCTSGCRCPAGLVAHAACGRGVGNAPGRGTCVCELLR